MAHGEAQQINLDSTEFQPRNEYVLVKPVELETGEKKTESGLIISITQNQSALDRPSTGEVVSVGGDIEDIKEGNFVLWPETDGIDLEFNDGTFMLLRQASVIGFKK